MYQRSSVTFWVAMSMTVCSVAPSRASDPTLGSEFQVNTYTTGAQLDPAVASTADGGFVVLWQSFGSPESSSLSIQGQRYSSDGSSIGGQFAVGATTSPQYDPAVAARPDGGFVVTWAFWQGGNALTGVQAQRYDLNGTAIGNAFQVDTSTLYYQRAPKVATAPDGGFVVVWQSDQSAGSDSSLSSIQARFFSSTGTPTAPELQVNAYTTGPQDSPALARGENGEFLVVWRSRDAPEDISGGIRGRRLSSNGQLAGQEFQVNGITSGDQSQPAITAVTNNEFTVVWRSDRSQHQEGVNTSIQSRRLSSTGQSLAGELRISRLSETEPMQPHIVGQGDGGTLVLWQSESSEPDDPQGASISALRLASDGSPAGSPFQVNTYTTGSQSAPSASAAADGRIMVVWQSQGSSASDISDESILGQLYLFPLFGDGFESGDTASWSSTVPAE